MTPVPERDDRGRVGRTRDGRLWTETHEPGGRLQRLFGPVFITGVFWFWLSNAGARVLPRGLAVIFVRCFVWSFHLFLWRVRRGITGNLKVVLGPAGWLERERRIHRTLRMFGLSMYDRYRVCHHRNEAEVRLEGADHWKRAIDHEQGIVFVSGHFGNWEMMARLPRRERCTLHVVREPSPDPKTQAFLEGLYAEHLGADLKAHYATDDPNLGTRLLLALRRGEAVAVSADQPRTGQSFIEVDLFGRPAPLPHGPAALARASGALIVPVFAIREGVMRYRVVVREPVEVPRTTDRDADLRQATQAIAAHLEWAIRESPHSWFCWWDRWNPPETAVQQR